MYSAELQLFYGLFDHELLQIALPFEHVQEDKSLWKSKGSKVTEKIMFL